eukprot:PhM_4_TR1208/c0_g2_i1/m.30205
MSRLPRQQVRALAKSFYHDLSLRESDFRDANGVVRSDAMRQLLDDLSIDSNDKVVDDVITEMYEYARSFRGKELGTSNGKGTIFELLRMLQQLLVFLDEMGLPRTVLKGAIEAQDLLFHIHETGGEEDISRPAFDVCVTSLHDALSHMRSLCRDDASQRTISEAQVNLLRQQDDTVRRRIGNLRWIVEFVLARVVVDARELLPNDDGAVAFWASVESRFTTIVTWGRFASVYALNAFEDQIIIPSWMAVPLQEYLDFGADNWITLLAFSRFINCFGPFIVSAENFVQVVSRKCVMFHTSVTDAEARVRARGVGSYVLTFPHDPHPVVNVSVNLGLAKGEYVVRTYKIVRDGVWTCEAVCEGGTYLHLDDFLTENPSVFKIPAGTEYADVPEGYLRRRQIGFKPLHEACFYGHGPSVQRMLDDGLIVFINETTFFDDTKMNKLPVWNGHSAEKLIYVQNRRLNAVMVALTNPDHDARAVVEVLLRNGIDTTATDAMNCTALYYAVRYNQASSIPLLWEAGCRQTGTATPLLLLSLGPGPFCLYSDNVNFAEYTPKLSTIESIIRHTTVPDIVLMRAYKFVEQLLDRTAVAGVCEDRFLSDQQREHNIAVTAAYYHRTCATDMLWRSVQRLLVDVMFVGTCKRAIKKVVAAPNAGVGLAVTPSNQNMSPKQGADHKVRKPRRTETG